jgi:hypothetical protein
VWLEENTGPSTTKNAEYVNNYYQQDFGSDYTSPLQEQIAGDKNKQLMMAKNEQMMLGKNEQYGQ